MIDLIHDCDPGNDDAVAILAALGSPNLNLLAVTTGAGHLAAERTAVNGAITVAAAAPRTVPVSAGSREPILRERLIARILDMDNGLDPVRSDLAQVTLDDLHSVDRIASEVEAHPGLTIVTTGPLTNLAVALRRHPDIAGRIARIVTLSGAWGLGTKSAAAEWNILCDPEAAAIVFESGIPITMVPVDASGTVPIDEALIARIATLPGRAAALAAELLASLLTTYRPGLFVPPQMPLHDPCAVLVAANPALVRSVPARVDVETGKGLSYGRTIIDFAGRTERPSNCDVVIEFDVAATHEALFMAIQALSRLQSQE